MRFKFFLLIFIFFCQSRLFAENYCVKKNQTTLQSIEEDKSLSSKWKAAKYTPLIGTGKRRSQYIEVTDMEGNKYWAKRTDLSRNLNCLMVKKRETVLRKGPGIKFPRADISRIQKYESFIDKGGEDGWTQIVNDDNELSWINLDDVWKARSNKIKMVFE